MKTRLTFIVVALMAMCAYAATTWQAAGDTPTAAGTVLVDNDLLTATTVYETTLQPSELTIADENFTHYIQVRVNKDPSAAAPAGEEYSGSTPIVVEAKKDLSLKLFYRRQSTGQTKGEDGTTAIAGDFALNDGKDVKVYDQSEFSLLGGEMTVLQTTSDFKYGYVTKVVQLKEGGKYVIAARGTTIQLFGMTAEGVEPPAPILGEAIAISPASGDISAALAEATAENPYPASVTINLAEGGEYTVGETINTIGALTLNGNGAVIDASALSGPMFAVSTTIPETLLLENGFYGLGDIAISDIEVKGLKAQLLYGNKMKFLISEVTLDNSVIGVAGGNKTVFDFNSGGVVGDLTVSNSTIWSNPAHEGQLFSTQSGQKVTEAGLDMQWYRILNSTIYNISYSKNVGTHRQSNQTWLGYEVKNSLILDSGKDGQFIKGLNGGQGGKNPTWQVSGNAFQRTVEGAWTDISANEATGDDDETVAENVEGVVAFAGDIATGDFTLADCAQKEAKVGDPRWIVEEEKLGEPIVLNVESGKDIAAAYAEATAENPYPASVTINLAEGGEYTVGETMNTIGALTVNGNGAVIDASALSAPVFAVSTTILEQLLKEDGFYGLGDIAISGIEVKGLKAQLLYGNKMKFLISKVTLDNSVIGVAGGNKTVFDFNGGGVVGDLTVSNSTIWSNPAHEGQLFSTQSGQKATEAGLEMQWYRILNSTIYNISYSKNVGTHRQSNQTWLGYEVKNSLILDSGKDGQFVKGLNGGQGGKNPTWQVSGNAFQRTVEGAWTDICDKEMTDDADEPVAENVPGVVAFAGDIATGDFTLAPCAQANAGIGDPRWLKDVHTLCIEIVDESCYATFFSSLYSFELPEGLSAGVIVKSDDLYSYADYIYEPGDVVPAGVPVIIKGSMGAYPAKIVEAEGKKPEVNLLMGYDINTPKEQSADNLYYKLSRSTKNGVKKLGFFWFNKDGHYNGCEYNKAYLCRPSASEANSFVMLLEGKTDGIEAIGQNEAGEKTIFTVSGMKVDNRQLQPGIYIINGKKSVVK